EQRVRYEYQDAAGSTHEGEAVEASEAALPPYRRGQTVAIQYRTDAPNVSRIAPLRVWSNWKLVVAAAAPCARIVAVAVWLSGDASPARLLSRAGALPFLPGFKGRRRRKLLSSPFPHAWLAYLRKNVGIYALLTPAEQERLQADLRVFVAEKRWEGC